jgi:hypothetical protein
VKDALNNQLNYFYFGWRAVEMFQRDYDNSRRHNRLLIKANQHGGEARQSSYRLATYQDTAIRIYKGIRTLADCIARAKNRTGHLGVERYL